MDDGLECKRCKEADTFEVLCDDCAASVFGRTDRLIARSRQAKQKAESVCKQLSPESLHAIAGLAPDHRTESHILEAVCRLPADPKKEDQVALTLHLIKLDDEREGYAELAEISSRVFFDDKYIETSVRSEFDPHDIARQNWQDQ